MPARTPEAWELFAYFRQKAPEEWELFAYFRQTKPEEWELFAYFRQSRPAEWELFANFRQLGAQTPLYTDAAELFTAANAAGRHGILFCLRRLAAPEPVPTHRQCLLRAHGHVLLGPNDPRRP